MCGVCGIVACGDKKKNSDMFGMLIKTWQRITLCGEGLDCGEVGARDG